MIARVLLGIDWGSSRIGLAIAFAETGLALPYKTVSTLADVLAVAKEEKVDALVLGWPLKMDGREVDAPELLAFRADLDRGPYPVFLVDERLSSLAADALPGNLREKVGRDEIAAMQILETYLSRYGGHLQH